MKGRDAVSLLRGTPGRPEWVTVNKKERALMSTTGSATPAGTVLSVRAALRRTAVLFTIAFVRRSLVASALIGVALVSGCVTPGSVEAGSQTATPSPAPVTEATRRPPPCPNPEGQACLGALKAGTSYTTTVFSPQLTYSVPADGWNNLEDMPGNFLLVPPGQPLARVDEGTADYIGVYTSVVASRFDGSGACGLEPVPDVDASPQAMVAWMRAQPSLRVTPARAVTVGGLHGLTVDVRTVKGAKLPSCIDAESAAKVTLFLLFSGSPPSALAHGVIPGVTMRLYLLDYNNGVLAIELDDVDEAPVTADQMSVIAEAMSFAE